MDSIPKGKQIAPFLVFFIIHSMQIGVGALGFQRFIAKTAGYDSWISVLIALAFSHIIMFIIFKIVKLGKGDLIDTHYFVYGKIVGRIFNLLFAIYFIIITVTIVRPYVEILQTWVFLNGSVFWFTLSFLLLAIYIINGGFRTIVGIAFFSVIIPFYLYFIFLFTLPYTDFSDFLPILDHSLQDIFKASLHLSISYLGYETLLIFYPFIQNGMDGKKWAHLGLLFTGFIYLYITILSFSYYSEEQLQHVIWPTLSMWKIVKLSFIWRFEYIGITTWSLVILPNICIALWCASRIIKKTINISQKVSLYIIAPLVLIISLILQTRQQIDQYITWVGNIGIIINYFYIPLLLLLVIIARKVRK
ncbi:GerAB/ArcD/ProY family transporter [Lederbergia lenta]|uniref:Spore germination protein n=1 Tax=Lederbergia lenta TaxID=1467 RepID=A0A2X4WVD4_LEDLE|nr:GerAB/ArcD/ProY family transporter [Lederbergia lenta]MEC2326626.1 GerAB/ArcD/ProY family transporter [Lederbergia lenta]SQI61650.1 spore germination protein [Lederbergia lenta]